MTTIDHSAGAVAPAPRGRSRAWRRKPSRRVGGTTAVVLFFVPPAILLFTLFVAFPDRGSLQRIKRRLIRLSEGA